MNLITRKNVLCINSRDFTEREKEKHYKNYIRTLLISLQYVSTTDFSRGKSGKKRGSFVGHKAINSAQLHSAAPGDERVDRDNFHLPWEYATPITDC